MTKGQIEVLIKVYESLSRNFDHFVIIVSDKEKNINEILPDPSLFWAGGYLVAKHIINDAVEKINRRKFHHVTPKRLIK